MAPKGRRRNLFDWLTGNLNTARAARERGQKILARVRKRKEAAARREARDEARRERAEQKRLTVEKRRLAKRERERRLAMARQRRRATAAAKAGYKHESIRPAIRY